MISTEVCWWTWDFWRLPMTEIGTVSSSTTLTIYQSSFHIPTTANEPLGISQLVIIHCFVTNVTDIECLTHGWLFQHWRSSNTDWGTPLSSVELSLWDPRSIARLTAIPTSFGDGEVNIISRALNLPSMKSCFYLISTGEDDEFYERSRFQNISFFRYPATVARFDFGCFFVNYLLNFAI